MLGMKRIVTGITVFVLSTGAWAAEYWIQVLSMKEGTAIDAAFMKRLKASGHAYETVVADGVQKVRIGNLPSYEAARRLLPQVRCKVATDAFIVEAEVQDPAIETVPKSLALITQTKPSPSKSEAAVKEKDAEAATVQQKESETVSKENEAQPCVCICDKHALRKAEIDTALSYYKNSSHHRFGTMEQGWFDH